MYKIYLDGTLFEDGLEWQDLRIITEYDSEFHAIVRKYSNELTFIGDAYEYLYNLSRTSGIDTQIECKIMFKKDNADPVLLVHDGIINITDVEFMMFEKKAACSIKDNHWLTFINNNKSIKAIPTSGKSKNNIAITAAAWYPKDMFGTTTATYDYADRLFLKVDECFNFMINFMSDAKVQYSSPYFSSGDGKNFYLTKGINLHNALSVSDIEMSFTDLFQEFNKRINLGMRVDITTNPPTLVIDKHEDIFTDSVSTTIYNPAKVSKKYDVSQMYAQIKFGSKVLNYSVPNADSNFINYRFASFNQEEYYLLGQNNIDTVLDLSCNWIVDTNIYEQILKNGNTSYDDDIFILIVDSTTPTNARKYIVQGGTTAFYNYDFINSKIALNWFGGIPSSIALNMSAPLTDFKAELSADFVLTGTATVPFNNEIFDTGALYNAALSRLVASTNSAYYFTIQFKAIVNDAAIYDAVPASAIISEIYLNRKDTFGTLIERIKIATIYENAILGFNFGGGYALWLNATDYAEIESVTYYNNALSISKLCYGGNSFFESTGNANSGGVLQLFEESDARVVLYDFEIDINELPSDTKKINFIFEGKLFGGWINRIEFSPHGGLASVQLFSKQ